MLAASNWLLPHLELFAESTAPRVTIEIDPRRRLSTMPQTFVGLSYESAQLGHPNFFSGENTGLIALFRRLASNGVLRLGGNTSDYATWSSNNAAAARNHTPDAFGPDAGTAAKTASVITPKAIQNLKDFLDATGWTAIYGLNLRHGTPQMAAAEAAYVAETLGPRLLFFQIGNEPDLFRKDNGQRWTFDHYWKEWTEFRDAVAKSSPGARFGAPDVADHYDWVVNVAEKKPEIEMLTGHYYAEGPPSNPKMDIAYLLRRGRNQAPKQIALVKQAVQILGKPFRMTEGNSCYDGGKPGVSNTFASALWGGDYMLQVAEAGYVGVNFHGGGYGVYTPIAGSVRSGFTARPVYYGMLLAGMFRGSTLVATTVSSSEASPASATPQAPENVTAFCGKDDDRWKLAIFNKTPTAIEAFIPGLPLSISGDVYLLKAPAITSESGVTLGGSEVESHGEFHLKPQSTVQASSGQIIYRIPPYTAVMMVSRTP